MKILLPGGKEVEVDYKYKAGGFDSYGRDGWTQGDPPEVEVISVLWNDIEVHLTDETLEFVELYILEHHTPNDDYYEEDYGDE